MGLLLARPKLLIWGFLALVLAASAAGLWWQGKRINSLQDSLAVERANVATMQAAIREQNAAVEHLAAEGRRRQGRAQTAVETAPVARPRVLEAMKAPPAGSTAADRVNDIDSRFLESLR